jgi:ATP-dependent DNA helicase DinG
MDIYSIVENFFSEQGTLSKQFENFEYRSQQKVMALAVLDSLDSLSHLFIEAPTGVGKSFAYLVPAILYAKKNKKKALISTYTINLQEQLIGKDIPFLQKVLPVDFKAALIKGKSNYLCPKRLRKAVENSNSLFESDETLFLERVNSWAKLTYDGTLSDISFPLNFNVWNTICAERGICTNKTCGSIEDTECFYQKAKHRASLADIVIVNHHLFFTLFNGVKKSDSAGYLFNNDFVIFDEAQTIENVAAENIIPAISREMVRYNLIRLYNDKKQKGLLLRYPALHVIPAIQNLLDLNEHFFSKLRKKFFDYPSGKLLKLTVRIYEKELFKNELRDEISNLINNLRSLKQYSKDDLDENQLQDFILRFTEINFLIDSFIKQKDNEQENNKFVYWIESSSMKPSSNVSLCVSPVDLSEYFREFIFKTKNSSILTSATLSVNNNFDYFKNRLGAQDCVDLQLPSPFDFGSQVSVYLVKDIPDPQKEKSFLYTDKLKYWLNYFINHTAGKALVLFTNSYLMKTIGSEMKDELVEKNINLYIQGDGDSRKNILGKFKKDTNSVLFGLDSFWLGVDVPGESLSNLIITKLPFQVPDHPLIQARLEFIEEKGGNSFMDYSLPEAVLKFRQGFGRLIRSKSDTGIIVILDSRILTKSYGKYFIAPLEDCRIEII